MSSYNVLHTNSKGSDPMEIIRIFDHSTGFDELYEGYIIGQLDRLIVEETNKQYNETTTTITPRSEVDAL